MEHSTHRLSRVPVFGTGPVDGRPVEEAERALALLSDQFASWMHRAVALLHAARDRARSEGLSGPAGRMLFAIVHDIKGEAAMLGYPRVGEAAGELHALLLSGPGEQLSFAVIERHVDAIEAALHGGRCGGAEGLR